MKDWERPFQDQAEVEYPLACDSVGAYRWAADAPRGSYTCLGCGAPMVLRRGEIFQPHFAHAAGYGAGCSLESTIHLAAKQAIVDAVASRQPIQVDLGHTGWFVPAVHEARAEHRFRSRSIDVALLTASGWIVLAIECRASHAVDDVKAEELSDASVPWIEVHAEDAARHPQLLNPIRHDCAWLGHVAVQLGGRRPALVPSTNIAWTCRECRTQHDVAMIACTRCGTFASQRIQDLRMKEYGLGRGA